MIKLFWFFCFSVGVNGSLNLSPERATQLAQDFEQELPGSVDWLYRWAMDEYIVDELHAVVNGHINMTARTKPESVAFFLFYRNPEIDITEFAQRMVRVFGSSMTPKTLAQQFFTIRSTITVPNWYYSLLYNARAANLPKADVIAQVFGQVSHMRMTGQLAHREFLFGTCEKRLRGLTFIWLRFGLPCITDESSPSTFNHATREWTLSRDHQMEVFRRLAILGSEE